MFNGKELFASFKFGLRLKIYKDSEIFSPTLSSRVISKILALIFINHRSLGKKGETIFIVKKGTNIQIIHKYNIYIDFRKVLEEKEL